MTRNLARGFAGGLIAGIVLVAWLLISARPAAVAAALAGGGLPLLLASLYRIVPIALNTASWRLLIPPAGRPPWPAALRMRWIGESVNALLPVAQIGGDFARARLLSRGGVSGADATAAMVADLSISAGTQVLFTSMGVAALAIVAPTGALGGRRLGSIAVAVVLTAALAGGLLLMARLGVGRLVAALPLHAHGRLAARLAAGAAGVDRALARVVARRGTLVQASLWHLAGWVSQVVETWLILRMLGVPVSWGAAFAIESLAASARGAAFAVPGGLGVQEGALVLLAAPFGIDMPSALALGVVKRGRELLVGAPAIVAWLVAERDTIGEAWRRWNMRERRRAQRAFAPAGGGPNGEGWLRVGVLVDLHWTPAAGGHVKTWERLAQAAASAPAAQLDLTVHFLGDRPVTQVVAPHVRYRIHRPLVSSAGIPFLSHVPDHTDLAPHNPMLTPQLRSYDLIHTTDAAFAAARTAARISRWHGAPLTSSVHTTTPYYTRVFTAATVERLTGGGRLTRLLLDRCRLAAGAEAHMQRLVDAHYRQCAYVLASRANDQARLGALLGPERVGLLRRGIDHGLFHPGRRDRQWLEAELGIPPDRRVVISVGRLDRIKNVLVLGQAIRSLVDRGANLQLLCAGKGNDRDALLALLGDRVTLPGVLAPETLARAYASADLCAQPAVIEELSNAVLEASSSGLPLLVAASSGSARFLSEGDTGRVVDGDGPEAWAGAVEDLVSDPDRLARMRRAAREWSVAHVPTWHQVLVEDLLPVWRRAAARMPTTEAEAPLAEGGAA